MKNYVVIYRDENGALGHVTVEAADAACALGLVIDEYDLESEKLRFTIAPEGWQSSEHPPAPELAPAVVEAYQAALER